MKWFIPSNLRVSQVLEGPSFGQASMKEKIIAFFTDVARELSKVTWPKREELRDSTVIVLVVCLIIAVFIYIVDTVVGKALSSIL